METEQYMPRPGNSTGKLEKLTADKLIGTNFIIPQDGNCSLGLSCFEAASGK